MGTVLITGAGRGLGLALHRRLANAGHEVVATDIVGADHVLDVGDPDACREAARRFRPDIWINNAGILIPGDAATQPDDDIERAVRVNLLGVIHGTRAAVEVMRERGSGHVITIASLASWVPVPGEAVYGATKAAVLSFSMALSAELEAQGITGVRISVVCPDGMMTPMITEVLDDPAAALSFSGTRVLTAEEVAAKVERVIVRPRRITSVPRWRGAFVRALSPLPDRMLPLAGVFGAIGRRNQAKALQRAQGR